MQTLIPKCGVSVRHCELHSPHCISLSIKPPLPIHIASLSVIRNTIKIQRWRRRPTPRTEPGGRKGGLSKRFRMLKQKQAIDLRRTKLGWKGNRFSAGGNKRKQRKYRLSAQPLARNLDVLSEALRIYVSYSKKLIQFRYFVRSIWHKHDKQKLIHYTEKLRNLKRDVHTCICFCVYVGCVCGHTLYVSRCCIVFPKPSITWAHSARYSTK